jgi:hypothetical protein
MGERVWDKFLTEEDKAVFAASGYGTRGGFGRPPAVLVIDVSYNFCGDRPEPILESIKRWPNSCGERAWIGVAAIRRLICTGPSFRRARSSLGPPPGARQFAGGAAALQPAVLKMMTGSGRKGRRWE